jgi:hypothetical protein
LNFKKLKYYLAPNLGNLVQVLICSMNELSSSTRKPKLIFDFGDPILPSLVINQACVRHIVNPHLQSIKLHIRKSFLQMTFYDGRVW